MKEALQKLIEDHKANKLTMDELIESIEKLYSTEEIKSLEDRKQAFIDSVRPFVTEDNKGRMNRFVKYWLERSAKGRKFRFEKETAFDVKKRIATWERNEKKFSVANLMKRK